MTKRIWILLAVVALVLSTLLPAALITGQSSSLNCVPYNSPVIDDEDLSINIGLDQSLDAKFVFPRPSASTYYADESLPVVVMTHGIGGNYSDLENEALGLADRCFSVLVFSYTGQGVLTWDIDSEFHFQGDHEREALGLVISTTIEGPPSVDLVDDDHIGMMGDSQGSLAVWIVVAENHAIPVPIQAAVPHNSAPKMSQVLLPQDCISANAAALFDPVNVRDPGPTTTVGATTPTSTPDTNGILWETVTYGQFAAAYLTSTPDIPFWQTAVATRDPGDELLPVTATGTPGTPIPQPYLFAQASQYDPWQWTDETIAGWQAVQPTPTLTPAYPADHLLIYKGGHVENGSPWALTNQEKINQGRAWGDWLQAYLFTDYTGTLTPVPTFTPEGGVPTNTPTPCPRRPTSSLS